MGNSELTNIEHPAEHGREAVMQNNCDRQAEVLQANQQTIAIPMASAGYFGNIRGGGG